MKKRDVVVAVGGNIVLALTALFFDGKTATPSADETLWPPRGWATASPESVGPHSTDSASGISLNHVKCVHFSGTRHVRGARCAGW
jgi:hypothetical protein